MAWNGLQLVTVFATTLALSGVARAMPWLPAPAPAPAVPPTSPAPPSPAAVVVDAPPAAVTAATALADADAAVAAGDLVRARDLFDWLARSHPDTPEAREARRAVGILDARARTTRPSPTRTVAGSARGAGSQTGDTLEPDPDAEPDHVVIRHEPYSTRTSERLRLTAWEKLDFGVTSFLYGMSVGFSYAIGLDSNDSASAAMPIALGAAAYTLGSVAFLKLGNPDRGDLPLALAITSYLPTTTLLIANAVYDYPDAKKTALAVASAGIVSVPIAIAAAQKLDLDPGDTQLVRDAGFWGLVLGTTGMLGFGGSSMSSYGFSYHQEPSGRATAAAGLLGLYGGLGLGILGATQSEVSLERVRVTTWGGYGGGVLGAVLGLGLTNGDEVGLYRGVAIGALAGLLVTFASTGSLDGIPPDDEGGPRAARTRWTPTLLSLADAGGKPLPSLGISGVMP
ncbi:MAG: hypothetical protein ABUS79_05040 [Pseudomonadota bacterium]